MPGESPDGKPDALHDEAHGDPTSPPGQISMTARSAALRVLADIRKGRRTARYAIDALGTKHGLTPHQIALITELVMGVVRHRLTLARVIGGPAEGPCRVGTGACRARGVR